MHTLEGPLSKWTNLIKGWQFRWFVLDDQTGILSYYTSKENMSKGERRGCIRLKGAHVGYDDEDDVTFTIKVDDKTFHLQARNLDEREKWVSKIEELIELHSNFTSKDNHNISLTNQDTQSFDLNLTESDSYLQLLIEELKILETKCDNCDDEEEIKKYNLLIASTKNFIETVKNAIVCLQIAKVNRDPANSLHTSTDLKNVLSNLFSLKEASANLEKANINQTEVAINTSTSIIRRTEKKINNSNKIPVASYSSSDDESFYDASDETLATTTSSKNTNNNKEEQSSKLIDEKVLQQEEEMTKTSTNAGQLSQKETTTTTLSKSTTATANNHKEFDDSLYENYDEDEEELNLNNQQNIISHLLSQVRIGMDLSKITLPTFILERRSLLEMYADFFAQTHLFVQIPDIEHPRDRIIQVVKWYLSAFHSGRRSHVAKKPYNPVLGELFQCWYTIPDLPEDPTIVTDGPVPWANRNQVSFICEQVSHHPPISAFYAEHYNKKIQIGGYCWTKSKFLGLSIGVHMVGKAVINLLERDEDYIFTFPSAYGRSILTVPWFEMGGLITISCPKTGYSADIDFLTKPFYSSKKNQIQGNIYGPPDKKPLITLEGEWTGVVYAKHGKKPPEIFVNPHNVSYVKKQLRPIAEQTELESRRLWYDVTHHLKKKQIDNATVFKQAIEQKQREEAKWRKDNSTKWKHKYFTEDGENWIYVNPLIKRINPEELTKNKEQQQQ